MISTLSDEKLNERINSDDWQEEYKTLCKKELENRKRQRPQYKSQNQVISDSNSMKCFSFALNAEKNGYVVTCSEPFPYSDAIIPSEYEGLPVVEIRQYMFYKTNLETVKIPGSIKTIGDNAFYGCKKLKQMTFTGTNAEWFSVEKGDNWNSETGDYIFNLGK